MPTSVRFFSHLRTGIAAAVTSQATENGLPQQGEVLVPATVTIDGLSAPVSRDMSLRGPSDVVRLDQGAVRAVEPAPGSRDCAPNFFPYIELSDPALPWMFTPAAPSNTGRLCPWLVLVVVPKNDQTRLTPLPGGAGLMLSLDDAAGRSLPPLSQAYAWAHIENREPELSGQAAFDADALVARLMCPVNLLPNAAYIAALVPAFEGGRLSGLGREGGADAGATLAWEDATGALDLPVYHHWEFSTGVVDFEELVRRLSPFEVPPETGLHDLDLSRPRGGLDLKLLHKRLKPQQAIISYRGALLSPRAKPKSWQAAHNRRFEPALEKVLTAQAPAAPSSGRYNALEDDPVIAPPTYGAFPHGKAALQDPTMRWMRQVNLNPETRATAGLGAQTVRADQEELMARAWIAAKGTREIGQHLRQGRVALTTGKRVHARLSKLDQADLVQVSDRLHPVIKSARATVAAQLTPKRAIPAGVISASFRRLSKQAETRLPADVKTSTPQISKAATVTCLSGVAATFKDQHPSLTLGTTAIQYYTFNGVTLTSNADFQTLAAQVGIPIQVQATRGRPRILAKGPGSTRSVFTNLQKVNKSLAPKRQVKSVTARAVVATPTARIRTDILRQTAPRAVLPPRVIADIAGLKAPPKLRVPIPAQVTIALDYAESAYARIAKSKPEFFMPGYGTVPDDTVSLLATNQAFVESYLLGVNHELAREFAWRQYPIALDGTWFRRFWDYDGDPNRKDISFVKSWPKTRNLGAGGSKGPSDAVILVKGDLFRRFPDTLVYAVQARWHPTDKDSSVEESPNNRLEKQRDDGWLREPVFDDPKKRLFPLFSGKIGNKGAFFGFDRQPEALVGSPDPQKGKGDPGWFVVFEQPKGRPQFGLDAPQAYRPQKAPRQADDLSWGHFAASEADLAALLHASAHPDWQNRAIEGKRWGRTAAETAALARQSPVRMMVHLGSLLSGKVR